VHKLTGPKKEEKEKKNEEEEKKKEEEEKKKEKKWHWDRFCFKTLSSSMSVSFHQCSILTYHSSTINTEKYCFT